MGGGEERISGKSGLQAAQLGLGGEPPEQRETPTQAREEQHTGCLLTATCKLCCAHTLAATLGTPPPPLPHMLIKQIKGHSSYQDVLESSLLPFLPLVANTSTSGFVCRLPTVMPALLLPLAKRWSFS